MRDENPVAVPHSRPPRPKTISLKTNKTVNYNPNARSPGPSWPIPGTRLRRWPGWTRSACFGFPDRRSTSRTSPNTERARRIPRTLRCRRSTTPTAPCTSAMCRALPFPLCGVLCPGSTVVVWEWNSCRGAGPQEDEGARGTSSSREGGLLVAVE